MSKKMKSPRRIILGHILPAVGAMMGTSLYVLGDTMLVGRALGRDGLSALNLSIPMINVLTGLGLLFGVGGATLLSIAKGRKEEQEARAFFTTALTLSFFTGGALSLFSPFYRESLLKLLAGDSLNIHLSSDYLYMLLFFSLFFLLFTSMSMFVRYDGGGKIAMAAMLSASIFNVIMDYVFLFPLNMGMAGCALATGLAPIVGLLVLSLHWFKGKSTLKPFFKFMSVFSVVKVGLSSFLLEISQGIVIFAFNIVFLTLGGDMAVSAYGIVANLSLLFTAILTGVSHGIAPLISYSYGAELTEHKYFYGHLALKVSVFMGGLITVTGILIPGLLSSLFIQGDPALVQGSVTGIRLYFLAFPVTGLNLILTTFLQSRERAAKAFLLSLQRGLLWVLVGLFILKNFGISGVWLVMVVAEIISFILTYLFLLSPLEKKVFNNKQKRSA